MSLVHVIKKGSASRIFHAFLEDTGYGDGRGLTGLLFSDGNIKISYARIGATGATNVTLQSISTLGTFVSGGFKEFDSTNQPGEYEIHIPDAAFLTGADKVVITIRDATATPRFVQRRLEIILTDFDLYAATVTVGTNNDKTGYTASTVSDKTGYSLTAGEHTAITADIWDAARSSHTTSGTFGQGVATVIGSVGSVTGGVTVTTNNDKTGYTVSTVSDKTGYSLTAGEETTIANAVWDTARGSHSTVGTFGEGVSAVQGNVTGSVASVTGAVGSVTGAVGSVTGNVGGNIIGSVASVTAGVTLAASAIQAIWDAATNALTTAGSIGKKLSSWILGTDNKVLVSTDVHSSGLTIVAVTGAVGAVVAGVTVSTNTDKAGYSLTSGERTSIADAVLVTPVSGVEGSLSGNCLGKSVALVLNKSSFNDSTNVITVRNTGDTSTLFTIPNIVQTVVDPITGKGQAT